jgi:TRAP-type mannitol/chloroaromatic compound transport system permease small subunit
MYAVMLLVSAEVVLRYFLGSPLGWPYDLISMYLMPAIFLLALSDTLREGHHVRVDLLYSRCSRRAQLVMSGIGYLLTAIVVSVIVATGTERFWDSLVSGDVIMTSVAWPTWGSAALVVVGFALLLLRLLYGVVAVVSALLKGDGTAEGIPISGEMEDDR